VELNAVVGKIEAHAVETAKEVEMPPGTAKLAVGGKLEPDLLLLAIARSISGSSTAQSASAVISLCSRLRRASFSAGGRSKLPT